MRMNFVVFLCCSLAGFGIASSPVLAQQKTVKACEAEWRANRADNQAKGITEKAYVAQCRSGTAGPKPTPASGSEPPIPSPTRARTPAPATTPSGANQFSTEAQAKARCPADIVVWANLPSRIYHFAGYRDYGHTKQGAYMCEKDATAQGYRASKTEKHPT
jgi:hypothetical protein